MNYKVGRFVKKTIDGNVYVLAKLKGKVPTKFMKELRTVLNQATTDLVASDNQE